MGFKGVNKKTGMFIIIGYVTFALVINLLTNLQTGMIVIALGMMFSGAMGIKNNSYAFIRAEEMSGSGKKMNGFMVYMNYLLLFLGLVLIVQ